MEKFYKQLKRVTKNAEEFRISIECYIKITFKTESTDILRYDERVTITDWSNLNGIDFWKEGHEYRLERCEKGMYSILKDNSLHGFIYIKK